MTRILADFDCFESEYSLSCRIFILNFHSIFFYNQWFAKYIGRIGGESDPPGGVPEDFQADEAGTIFIYCQYAPADGYYLQNGLGKADGHCLFTYLTVLNIVLY